MTHKSVAVLAQIIPLQESPRLPHGIVERVLVEEAARLVDRESGLVVRYPVPSVEQRSPDLPVGVRLPQQPAGVLRIAVDAGEREQTPENNLRTLQKVLEQHDSVAADLQPPGFLDVVQHPGAQASALDEWGEKRKLFDFLSFFVNEEYSRI